MDDFNVVTTGFSVETNPVGGRRAAYKHEFILGQMEQNAVADNVTTVAYRYVLFGAVYREAGKTVDGGVGQQFDCIRTFNVNVHHMVRLVKKYCRFTPCSLFAAPVMKFRCNNR